MTVSLVYLFSIKSAVPKASSGLHSNSIRYIETRTSV